MDKVDKALLWTGMVAGYVVWSVVTLLGFLLLVVAWWCLPVVAAVRACWRWGLWKMRASPVG